MIIQLLLILFFGIVYFIACCFSLLIGISMNDKEMTPEELETFLTQFIVNQNNYLFIYI